MDRGTKVVNMNKGDTFYVVVNSFNAGSQEAVIKITKKGTMKFAVNRAYGDGNSRAMF